MNFEVCTKAFYDACLCQNIYYYKERIHRETCMVEFDVKMTAGDLYDFLLRHNYNSLSGLLASILGALGVIVGLSTHYWIYLILGVVILVYLPWALFIKSKQSVVSNPIFKETMHYTMDENGISMTQGETTGTLKWEDCLKAVSTSRSIMVYTAKNAATIFPKKQLKDKTTDVIEMISTHMPPAKVKIRC